MSSTDSSQLRRFPLHDRHEAREARFGAFGDWEVPLYYQSILEEHEAVRNQAGLFDISHMGEFFFSGSGTVEFLERLLPRYIAGMANGRALYMPLLNDHGGIVDDIILYRQDETRFMMIVNAANVEKDAKWIRSQLPQGGVEFKDRSNDFGLLALQGPKSAAILETAFGAEYAAMKNYHFKPCEDGIIASTGYTGEKGFEIMVPTDRLKDVWDRLFKAGAEHGLIPVGFGARDTLRLEAGMLLYGHDMNDSTTPLEAGIGWAVDVSKEGFIGREALKKQVQKGFTRKLIGFVMMDRGIPREGYEIKKSGKVLGHVTSGTASPTLKKSIGLGYVPTHESGFANNLEIIIRGKSSEAKIVHMPFYKSEKK